ncbi:MAG: hypothetical protein JO257_23300 [Deltaproteobacteria bacterium]|nr:hypothetical protein [Deltaproteobacteria bacterium]
MAANDDELLAAYVDGVAELTPEERKRIEGRLDELDVAGTRDMIQQLRALPPEGTEPDWRALQARIAKAVDDAPRPWWRRWFVPVGGLVVIVGAALLLVTMRHDDQPARAPAPIATAKAPVIDAAAVPVPQAQPTELWLDGQIVDVGDADPEALFDDLDVPDAVADDTLTVDELDDKALDNLDRWLERKKS